MITDKIISKKVKDEIKNLDLSGKSIVVLKGIPLSTFGNNINNVNLDKIVDDKINAFMEISKSRKYISYEEFLLLSDFILSYYDKVYVLNNNIYINQYQIEENFSKDIKNGLLEHFRESELEEDDNIIIGNIDKYLDVFANLENDEEGLLIGSYNDSNILENYRIRVKNLFKHEKIDLIYREAEENDYIIDIVEEKDYLYFLKRLHSEEKEINIRISNYTGDKNRLKNRIEILSNYWKYSTNIRILKAKKVEEKFNHKDEYNEILKRYWGYNSYRNLKVYDTNSLDNGEKKVVEVSQENIIANLVDQVEKCGERKDFRDLFVTAPTGAGKSVMFQVPAIYLAEKYDLLTIVISPLIGLMNDQVKNLEIKSCDYAKTINSDISPIIKQEIMEKVANGKHHILYISPETLLSRGDVEQLIGDRTIGMVVIDEAHIVTTWGKQFRPDYWYLGDHIKKLRKRQLEKKERSFVVATFTATAIYQGIEDMYNETIDSLNMLNPITYLGYVKRDDIEIKINKGKNEKKNKTEYELDKFEQIENILKRAILMNKKVLVYFPTVALINRCYDYFRSKQEVSKVTYYYGTLDKDKKQENYEEFCSKKKLMMLATKAFGMGIDINDIEIVVHFAPTGNVCDYVQEIGRAARRKDLSGEAIYNYDKQDFKHINRLHGMSTVREYQLINVIKKILELYKLNLEKSSEKIYSKKKNAMLLDAENFSYIFKSPIGDEENNINKVKTALLLIQKDFENKMGFSPINVRPIPMSSIGFFEIDPKVQKKLLAKYPGTVEEIESKKHICKVLLSKIWKRYSEAISFAQFKYMLYSKQPDFDFNIKYPMNSALWIKVDFKEDYISDFKSIFKCIKEIVYKNVQESKYISLEEMSEELNNKVDYINKYKSNEIFEVLIASLSIYKKNFQKGMSQLSKERYTVSGSVKYKFNSSIKIFFKWIEDGLNKIISNEIEGNLFVVNDFGNNKTKEMSTILGLLESMGVLNFEMSGGTDNQIYIYINQVKSLEDVIRSQKRYKNNLLEIVSNRHIISSKMLTYIYEGDFKSEEIWNIIENYFLGIIPEDVKKECLRVNPNITFN